MDTWGSSMLLHLTPIPDLQVITPPRFGDARGFFAETYSRDKLVAHGITLDFVQDNHSLSAQAGTVRGPTLSSAAACAGQAGALWAGGVVRCGGRYPALLAQLWALVRGRAEL